MDEKEIRKIAEDLKAQKVAESFFREKPRLKALAEKEPAFADGVERHFFQNNPRLKNEKGDK